MISTIHRVGRFFSLAAARQQQKPTNHYTVRAGTIETNISISVLIVTEHFLIAAIVTECAAHPNKNDNTPPT